MDELDPARWRALVKRQAGVVSRAQLLARGITDDGIAAHVAARRWRRLLPGVYLTSAGPDSVDARRWAALLHGGPGAALSHDTAGMLWGLVDGDSAGAIHVTVPRPRAVGHQRGIRVHQSRRPVTPVGDPPRTSPEATVCDLAAQAAGLGGALAVLAQARQRDLVTSERLAIELLARPTQRWRRLLISALGDVDAGAHSVLELHYVNKVERPHGLPTGQRQRRVGRTRQDVHYDGFRATVELDGRLGHADAGGAWRDMARDNAATLRGETTLRFGWADVTAPPCDVAAQVPAAGLRAAGWSGLPSACGPQCPTPAMWATSSRLSP